MDDITSASHRQTAYDALNGAIALTERPHMINALQDQASRMAFDGAEKPCYCLVHLRRNAHLGASN